MTDSSGRSESAPTSDDSARAANLATVQSAESTAKALTITRVSVLVTVVALLVASVFSFLSYRAAEQQNTNAEQQELVALITDISQEPASLAQAESIKNSLTSQNAHRTRPQRTP
jgi:uncharacterized protein HemX